MRVYNGDLIREQETGLVAKGGGLHNYVMGCMSAGDPEQSQETETSG